MKQITFKKVLSLLMLLAVVFLTTNCKSQKSTTKKEDSNVVVRHCHGVEYHSTSDYIRASGVGTSSSQDMADKKALSSARTKLAAELNTLVSTVNTIYGRSMTKDGVEDLSEDYETMTREVVKQKLSGATPFCTKMTKENNMFTSYVALQLNGEELYSAIGSKISKNDKTQINFEKHQYKKIYDEEMKKFDEANN